MDWTRLPKQDVIYVDRDEITVDNPITHVGSLYIEKESKRCKVGNGERYNSITYTPWSISASSASEVIGVKNVIAAIVPTLDTTAKYIWNGGALFEVGHILSFINGQWTGAIPSDNSFAWVSDIYQLRFWDGSVWNVIDADTHNSLFGVEGGDGDHYYHLGSDDYTNITNLSWRRPVNEMISGNFPVNKPNGYRVAVKHDVVIGSDSYSFKGCICEYRNFVWIAEVKQVGQTTYNRNDGGIHSWTGSMWVSPASGGGSIPEGILYQDGSAPLTDDWYLNPEGTFPIFNIKNVPEPTDFFDVANNLSVLRRFTAITFQNPILERDTELGQLEPKQAYTVGQRFIASWSVYDALTQTTISCDQDIIEVFNTDGGTVKFLVIRKKKGQVCWSYQDNGFVWYNGANWEAFEKSFRLSQLPDLNGWLSHTALKDRNGSIDEHTQFLPRNGYRQMTGTLDMGTQRITNLQDGTEATDATNVRQISALLSGVKWIAEAKEFRHEPPEEYMLGVDRFIIDDTPEGEWAGFAKNDLVFHNGLGWVKETLEIGNACLVLSTNMHYVWNGVNWNKYSQPTRHSSLIDVLTGDDHLQYLHTKNARTGVYAIEAQHEFAVGDVDDVKAPFILRNEGTSGVVVYFNSDMVDGFHASQDPLPNTIPVRDSSGNIGLTDVAIDNLRINRDDCTRFLFRGFRTQRMVLYSFNPDGSVTYLQVDDANLEISHELSEEAEGVDRYSLGQGIINFKCDQLLFNGIAVAAKDGTIDAQSVQGRVPGSSVGNLALVGHNHKEELYFRDLIDVDENVTPQHNTVPTYDSELQMYVPKFPGEAVSTFHSALKNLRYIDEDLPAGERVENDDHPQYANNTRHNGNSGGFTHSFGTNLPKISPSAFDPEQGDIGQTIVKTLSGWAYGEAGGGGADPDLVLFRDGSTSMSAIIPFNVNIGGMTVTVRNELQAIIDTIPFRVGQVIDIGVGDTGMKLSCDDGTILQAYFNNLSGGDDSGVFLFKGNKIWHEGVARRPTSNSLMGLNADMLDGKHLSEIASGINPDIDHGALHNLLYVDEDAVPLVVNDHHPQYANASRHNGNTNDFAHTYATNLPKPSILSPDPVTRVTDVTGIKIASLADKNILVYLATEGCFVNTAFSEIIAHSDFGNIPNDTCHDGRYIRATVDTTVSGQLTFSRGTAETHVPPFLLGIYADEKVDYLNADRLDGYHADGFARLDADNTFTNPSKKVTVYGKIQIKNSSGTGNVTDAQLAIPSFASGVSKSPSLEGEIWISNNIMYYSPDGTAIYAVGASIGSTASTWVNPVLSKTATKPGTPANGDRYIVIDGGTWDTGKGNYIAQYTATNGWMYIVPVTGYVCYNVGNTHIYIYNGSAWIEYILPTYTAGDVFGPSSTTANKVPQWDTTTKTLKDGLTVGTSASNLVQLDSNAKYPAADGSQITNIPGMTSYTKTSESYTLPASPTVGDTYEVIGLGTAWVVTANTSQYIRLNGVESAAAGHLDSGSGWDCVTLIYVGTIGGHNTWNVKQKEGSITVT